VKEIEAFARKHRFEVVFCLSFIFACFFSFVFFGAGAAVLFGAIGGILGVLFPSKIEHFGRTIFNFVFKQEQTTQIVLAVVWVVLSIFLPPLVFLFLGLHGGKSIQHMAMELYSHYLK
jgi:membrane associated rhomboid family serine protease